MTDQIMVSIICTTYNHENYIEETMNGFLMQKTDYSYEILVHDDASTDKTAEIIRDYAEKYPDIIRPIYQTENQYSKGVSISKTFLYPAARGKYLALCEGDDYWIDENKLQRQVDFLESHSEYTMCCHNSYRYYMEQNKFELENPIKEEGDVPAEELILEPNRTWIATASIVLRREMVFDHPEFFRIAPVPDFPLKLFCFCNGKVFYYKEAMSVYRREDPNAWTMKIRNSNNMKIEFYSRLCIFLKEFDKYTNYEYHKYLKKRWQGHIDWRNRLMDEYPNVKENKYFKQMPLTFRTAKRVKYYHPELYKRLVRFKHAVKG